MARLLHLLILFPFLANAHPGVGIVKDSKGNIYYTDLQNVWKMVNGKPAVAIPAVHTHELWVDQHDNLYGEGSDYDAAADKFYHYLWVYRPNGRFDTVIGRKQAYLQQDFSLARDRFGNEYYIKRFLKQPEWKHIYKRSPGGAEQVYVRDDFENVNWLHVQSDGSMYYVKGNAIYHVSSRGDIRLVKDSIAAGRVIPGDWARSLLIWGVWPGKADNLYVAVFSEGVVKRIDAKGNVSDIYRSKSGWKPLHGVFDNDNKLWILEASDKNEVRVVFADNAAADTGASKNKGLKYAFISGCLLLVVGWRAYYVNRRRRAKR